MLTDSSLHRRSNPKRLDERRGGPKAFYGQSADFMGTSQFLGKAGAMGQSGELPCYRAWQGVGSHFWSFGSFLKSVVVTNG